MRKPESPLATSLKKAYKIILSREVFLISQNEMFCLVPSKESHSGCKKYMTSSASNLVVELITYFLHLLWSCFALTYQVKPFFV